MAQGAAWRSHRLCSSSHRSAWVRLNSERIFFAVASMGGLARIPKEDGPDAADGPSSSQGPGTSSGSHGDMRLSGVNGISYYRPQCQWFLRYKIGGKNTSACFSVRKYQKPGMSFDQGCNAALEAAKKVRLEKIAKGIMKPLGAKATETATKSRTGKLGVKK